MDDADMEAMIATLTAKIRASSLNRAVDVKEPFDGPLAMMPVAYAMFAVLADACIGSGHSEEDWWEFLRGALEESIHNASERVWSQ